MKRKLTIEYDWHNDDYSEINTNHIEVLEEDANEQIFKMLKEGFNCGELHTSILMTDDDLDNSINYSGWWESSTKRL
jgi:hypothetical protein